MSVFLRSFFVPKEGKLHHEENTSRQIALNGLVAGLYAAVTILTASFAYGNIQFRIAEALCPLVALEPSLTIGLTLGCLIANLFSTVSALDIIGRHGGDVTRLPPYALHQKGMGAAAADDSLQYAHGRRDALGGLHARERVLEGTCGIRRGGWRGRGRCLIHPRHSALSVIRKTKLIDKLLGRG